MTGLMEGLDITSGQGAVTKNNREPGTPDKDQTSSVLACGIWGLTSSLPNCTAGRFHLHLFRI